MLYCVTELVTIRCIMALIWGVGSLFPCPRCLISCDKLGDLSVTAPLRTADHTRATILEAREEDLLGDKEESLKCAGLRDVDVRLHSYGSHFILLLTISSTECILED